MASSKGANRPFQGLFRHFARGAKTLGRARVSEQSRSPRFCGTTSLPVIEYSISFPGLQVKGGLCPSLINLLTGMLGERD